MPRGNAAPFDFASDYRPAPDINKFLSGTPPILGLTALEIGVDLLADAPGMAEQILFDQKLIDAGIVDEQGKGPRYAELQEMMRQRKARSEQAG